MIFCDTSFLVALEIEGDGNHRNALQIAREIASGKYGRAYVSDYIFDETMTTTLSKTRDVGKAIRIGNAILSSAELLRVGEKTFEAAWKIFKKQNEPRFSFTDCTNIALIEENRINNLATFDSEFKKIANVNVVS